MERIALHTCCGPCAVSVVPSLRALGLEPLAYFANPNIHPAMEWLRRLQSLEDYAKVDGVAMDFEPEYGLPRFLDATTGYEGRCRCRQCFLLRLTSTAEWAAARGIERLTSTLLASPYQDRELILEVGDQVAKAHGVLFMPADFRGAFREGQARAKELGLYRQSYCGCVFSEAERYERKLARKYASRSGSAPPRDGPIPREGPRGGTHDGPGRSAGAGREGPGGTV